MTALTEETAQALPKGSPAMDSQEAGTLMNEIGDWQMSDDAKAIHRSFKFKNFYETVAFVNAVAWIANQQDHHPDLEVSYNRCTVHFSTHSVGGLSRNDFICAAKIDALMD
jgi:4a-hydroxytetrahydrobiopterin dehydratase